jgi:hypothetical protein
MSTRSFRKIVTVERTRQRRESLLPPEGKIAIVPRQQKALHVGRGARSPTVPSAKLSRAVAHNLHCTLVLATNLDVFWIKGVEILYPQKRHVMVPFLFNKSRISIIVAGFRLKYKEECSNKINYHMPLIIIT